MTRYWYDCEFIDDSKTIDLISIGIVADDGREYYAQSVEFDHRKASQWVKDNVLTHLQSCPWANVTHVDNLSGYVNELNYHGWGHGQCLDQWRGFVHNCPWRTREQLKRDILSFIDPLLYGKPELWGWCAGYDWVALCQLFGTMMDIPSSWPHYVHEIQQVLDEREITDDKLPQLEGQAHNALSDARQIQKIWDVLKGDNNNGNER